MGIRELLTRMVTASQPIAPEIDNDRDSSYDSDIASSTASVSASILQYRTLHGRTFHSDKTSAEYWYEHYQLGAFSLLFCFCLSPLPVFLSHHLSARSQKIDLLLFRGPNDERQNECMDIM
jgi:hypothetical protein